MTWLIDQYMVMPTEMYVVLLGCCTYIVLMCVHEISHWLVATCFGVKLTWLRYGWRLVFTYPTPSNAYVNTAIKRAGFAGEVLTIFSVISFAVVPIKLTNPALSTFVTVTTLTLLTVQLARIVAYRIFFKNSPYNDFA